MSSQASRKRVTICHNTESSSGKSNTRPQKPHRDVVKQQQRTHGRSKHNGKKVDADWRNWRDESTTDLNWQQESLLKSKRSTLEASQPTWASSLSNASVSSKGNKRRSRTSQASHTLLPPLRFSAAPGKAAWRFVLPSPKPPRSNDLPDWCDGKKDNLVVTLGSRRSTPSSSDTSSPPSTPDLDSSSSLSFDSSLIPTEEQHGNEEPGCSSINGLVSSMLGSLSIYAGPSFSAAAPEACNLPFPSFLIRS